MSLGKVARKLKRVGKTAYQFRITSTFEYIDLSCNGTWRPENLRVIWLRSHRRVQSIDVKWKPTEDRGPNGAVGRGIFEPSFSVALLVTVYGDPSGKEGSFEDKEYKYYIESDGPSGKKIVASFNMDISEYASLTGSRHTLDMSFKPVSKKINKAVLGITLQSEFMKQGNAIDDDMQSTFSAVSAGQDSLQFDEEEELEAAGASEGTSEKGLPLATGDTELVTLGTGECLKRTTLPTGPPRKPERRSPNATPAMERKMITEEIEEETEAQLQDEADVEAETAATGDTGLMYMNLSAEGEAGKSEGEIQAAAPWDGRDEEREGKPREQAKDRVTSRRSKRQREKQERDREKQEEKERRQKEKKEERERKMRSKSPTPERKSNKSKSPTPERRLKDRSKSPTPEVSDSPALPPREKINSPTNGEQKKEEKEEEQQQDEAAAKAAEVVMKTKPNDVTACGQPISVTFDTRGAGKGSLTAVCKGTKTERVQTSIQEEPTGHYRVQFTPEQADMFMLSVYWGGHNVPGSPFLINLNLLPSATETSPGTQNGGGHEGGEWREIEQSDGWEVEEVTNQPRENRLNEDGGDKKGSKLEAKEVAEKLTKDSSGEVREGSLGVKSPVILVSDEDPFNMAYEASRMLEQQRTVVTAAKTQPKATPSGRKIVASKEDWTPPTNHLYEDMPEEEEVAKATPTVSPLESWLGNAQFVNCFGEVASPEKLEEAEIIGLYFSANWCPPCRRFLPKLVKFYHNLKQNQKSFEMLYISSDYSKQEMTKYMQEQQMPWLALAFESPVADKLRADYSVAAIPILTIVSKTGVKLEERARKAVEQATSISAVLKLYNKWLEKSQSDSVEGEEVTGKKGGLLKTLKSTIAKPSKEATVELSRSPGGFESQKSVGDASDTEGGGGRVIVEQRSRTRSKKVKESSGPTAEEMEEKEERLRHLEEVNMSLKQTNDDLNEEVAELKRQIGEFQAKLTSLEKCSKQLEDEKRELMANLNIRGWLLKKGLKGPTANLWRRRYFRCDQGSKIYYYKSASEGSPQGFIDLDLVVSVQEISAAQQDKNHATFLVQCEGRTFQLQAHDETTMRKWMSAIEYLKNWRQRNDSSAVRPL